MAQRRNCNATREIDILLALLIPDSAALAFYRNELCRSINRQDHFIESRACNCCLFNCHLMITLLRINKCEIIITKYA